MCLKKIWRDTQSLRSGLLGYNELVLENGRLQTAFSYSENNNQDQNGFSRSDNTLSYVRVGV
jgi:hypothetical protein